MGRSIRHRGPDEEGFLVSEGVGLVIERLKVIDLQTGQQPIYNETRDVAVVYNGEIYNYRELRESLEKQGHKFTTQSDTETIVHLYEEHGADFLNRLNGMFAIALWDFKRRLLLLARDPAGVKPLFFTTVGGVLRFASEIKAILEDPTVPREADPDALWDYLSFYYPTAPRTMFRHIHRLPAGHRLIAQSGKVSVERYWDMSYSPEEAPSQGEWEERVRETFDASVRRHLQSDVPVGLYLSGGIDSSSLAASASAATSKLKTYSVGYEESSYSELSEAREVAKFYGTDHHEFVLESRLVSDLLPEAIKNLDEPHGDWSHLPNYFLSSQAKKSVTVVLVGTGGDELFGGYPTYLAAKAGRMYRKIPDLVRRGIIKPFVEAWPSTDSRMSLDFMAKSFVRGADSPLERAHHGFKEIFNAPERGRLLKSSAPGVYGAGDPFAVFEQYQDRYDKMDWMDRLMYLDFKVFMADCSLQVNDRTTAAHSLEGRVPFLDKEMISLASRIPWRWKVRRWTTKFLLRQAMSRRLPQSVLRMPKKGFLLPGAVWLKGPLKPLVQDVVAAAEKDLGWLFDFKQINRLIEEHQAGRQDHTRRISCLVSLFLWNDIFKPAWPDRPALAGRA